MCQRIVFCLFISIGLMVNFQAVNANITGKVSKLSGDPIAGATLTLVDLKVSATSGADGTYALATTGISTSPSLRPHSTAVTLDKGVLKFSLLEPSPVKVEIFDVQGNLLNKEVWQNAQAGYYRLSVVENYRSTKIHVIRASIGQKVTLFRYLPLNNGKSLVNSSVENPAIGKMAKITAINDTLKVTATGYEAKALPITSYDQVLNITLNEPGSVVVNLDKTFQTIQGFGINATIMPSGKSLPWDQLYKTEGADALGLSILRIGMNENGGHRDVPSDYTKAKNLGAKIIGSCWSAPASWKTNNNVNQGGHLKPEYYSQWATRIADYAKSNSLYAMSIANESDFASCASKGPPCTDDYPSMVYTAKEMVEFVKVAGPIFKQKAPGIKMIAPEASLWIHVWSTLSSTKKAEGFYDSSDPLGCGCFSNDINDATALAKCNQKCLNGDGYNYGHWLAKDTEAWNAFDILGVHEYESQIAFPWPADVTEGKRTKEVWQTEMSGVKYWPEQGPSITIDNGLAVAGWIHSALTIGEASAWCYWWYEAYYQNDNEGLALIQGNSTKAKRYYTFGNYSRFVRPGYIHVDIAGNIPANVLLSAYKGTDGTVVVVAINKGSASATVPISISGGTAPASFTPWVTSANENLVSKTAVSVSGGTFTATLASKSVTTFVGK
jgi:O-glycosyl hydrolase